jgi:tRNA A37 threonylcarbamoyladenosine biosynthesis protein TsaE
MKELIEWLEKANKAVEYGEIEIKLVYHQGQLISMEKHIIHKTKFAVVKKTDK